MDDVDGLYKSLHSLEPKRPRGRPRKKPVEVDPNIEHAPRLLRSGGRAGIVAQAQSPIHAVTADHDQVSGDGVNPSCIPSHVSNIDVKDLNTLVGAPSGDGNQDGVCSEPIVSPASHGRAEGDDHHDRLILARRILDAFSNQGEVLKESAETLMFAKKLQTTRTKRPGTSLLASGKPSKPVARASHTLAELIPIPPTPRQPPQPQHVVANRLIHPKSKPPIQPGRNTATPPPTPITTTPTPLPITLLAPSPSPAPSLPSQPSKSRPSNLGMLGTEDHNRVQLFTQLYSALRPAKTVFKKYYCQGVSGGPPQPVEMNPGPITVGCLSSRNEGIL